MKTMMIEAVSIWYLALDASREPATLIGSLSLMNA
jgi:hypothetical protein